MDYSKLTRDEILESIRDSDIDVYTIISNRFPTLHQGLSYPTPITDLYIAHMLHDTNFIVPPGYNPDLLPSPLFLQLAQLYHLPVVDTSSTRTRASRITRILTSLNTQKHIPPPTPHPNITQKSPASIQHISHTTIIQRSPSPIQPTPKTNIIQRSPASMQHVPKTNIIQRSPAPIQPNTAKTNIIQRSPPPIQPNTSKIEITPFSFTGPGRLGDFSWMINNPEYKDTLFIFNDNQEQFISFMDFLSTGQPSSHACSAGGGNSVIRPYQCQNPPRSAGIPTGSNGKGYDNLESAKPYIDASIQHIRRILSSGSYSKVAYSSGKDGVTLGASIYSPSPDILQYITQSIQNLG